jgi:hypothetical protein
MYCLLFLNFVPHVQSAIAFDPQIYSRTRLFSNSGTSAFLFALLLSIVPFFPQLSTALHFLSDPGFNEQCLRPPVLAEQHDAPERAHQR